MTELHDLLKQRVLHIAAGYEDANDANTLRHDPIFKLLLGRLPASGPPLASQPTISRFENRVSRTELYRLARVFVDHFIASYDRPPKLIVLDFDDTEDPAHGRQEQVRYDGYYGGYCFLPLHVYEGLSGRLLTTIFQAKRFSGAQLLAVLKRLVTHLRHAWPATLIVVRGDSHFAYPEVMQWIEAQDHLHSVTGLTTNRVLQKLAHEVVEQAKRAYGRDGGKVTRFHKSDRASCHRFAANQFRLFLHAAAYVLLDTLRREVLQGTPWARATMETIQLRLLKLGARVQELTDRIKISLPASCPVAPVLRRSLTLLACVRLT